MKTPLFLFACLLLSACSFREIGSSSPETIFSSDSSIPEDDSSFSSRNIEKNDDLRLLFARMETNMGSIRDTKGLEYVFYGEAYENSEGTGFLTNGEQGIFDFRWEKDGETITIGTFHEPGSILQKRGFAKMAKGSENLFRAVGEKEFVATRLEGNPFIEECLSLFQPHSSSGDLAFFSFQIKTQESLRIAFSFSEENEEESVLYVENLGLALNEDIARYLANPIQKEAPEKFTEAFQKSVEERWGSSFPLPFPKGISYAFFDQILGDGDYQWCAYQAALADTYLLQLRESGFELDHEKAWKSTGSGSGARLLSIRLRQEEGWTKASIRIEKTKETASNFARVNSLLQETPYPSFPVCSSLLEATIWQENEENYHIEAVFITEEAGANYFEEDFAYAAKEKGFRSQKILYSTLRYNEYTRDDTYSIYVSIGKSAPAKGFPFGIDLSTL